MVGVLGLLVLLPIPRLQVTLSLVVHWPRVLPVVWLCELLPRSVVSLLLWLRKPLLVTASAIRRRVVVRVKGLLMLIISHISE